MLLSLTVISPQMVRLIVSRSSNRPAFSTRRRSSSEGLPPQSYLHTGRGEQCPTLRFQHEAVEAIGRRRGHRFHGVRCRLLLEPSEQLSISLARGDFGVISFKFRANFKRHGPRPL